MLISLVAVAVIIGALIRNRRQATSISANELELPLLMAKADRLDQAGDC
jgi:hypothetical protein